MSTSWFYRCASHNPPLGADSDGWPGKDQLAKDLRRRNEIVSIPEFMWSEWDVDFPRHYRWLWQHDSCSVELCSEYGEVAESIPAVVHVDCEPVANARVVVRHSWISHDKARNTLVCTRCGVVGIEAELVGVCS